MLAAEDCWRELWITWDDPKETPRCIGQWFLKEGEGLILEPDYLDRMLICASAGASSVEWRDRPR
jgi:hypothetical protein